MYQPVLDDDHHNAASPAPSNNSGYPGQTYAAAAGYPVAPSNPVIPPAMVPVGPPVIPADPTPTELRDRIYFRHVMFHLSSYFSDAWGMYKRNFCVILAALLVGIIVIVGMVASEFGVWWAMEGRRHRYDEGYYPHRTHHSHDSEARQIEVLLALAAVRFAFVIFFLAPLTASSFIGVFNAMRTDGVLRFSDITQGYKIFGRVLKFAIINVILMSLLALLFIFPAVIFGFFTILALPIYLDHSFVGVFESFRYSSKVVSRYFCDIFGYILISFVVLFLGALALGVGLIVSVPLCFVATIFMYHHLVGVRGCPLAPAIVPPAPVAMPVAHHTIAVGPQPVPMQNQYPYMVPAQNVMYPSPHQQVVYYAQPPQGAVYAQQPQPQQQQYASVYPQPPQLQ